MEPTLVKHIESTPGVCGGKPRVAGTRIRVQDIMVWHELRGMSPDQIVADFPQLTHGDVHAALTYYFDHREEIHREMERAEDLVNAIKAANPSLLQQKLAGRDPDDGPVSP
jgi:uncharacterized protein (DUF433 family)